MKRRKLIYITVLILSLFVILVNLIQKKNNALDMSELVLCILAAILAVTKLFFK
jgi:hypothetical protein